MKRYLKLKLGGFYDNMLLNDLFGESLIKWYPPKSKICKISRPWCVC